MKKFLIALVALLALLFYTFVTTYTFSIYNTSDGYVLSDSVLREQLFSSDSGENIKANEVKAGEGIYTRGKTVYFGDEQKVKVNTAFPLYVKNGEAIQLLSGNETLITTEYEFKETFKYSILSNGRLFNESYQEADAYDYLLVHLTNNLYVNTKEIYVSTILHEYTIPENSIIYFNSEYIRYYRYFEGEFIYDSIIDVDYESVISADGADELSYKDFLLKLGEIVEYTNSENTGRGKKETEEDFEDITGQQQEKNKSKSGASSKPEKVEANQHNEKAPDPAPAEEPDPDEEPGMDIKYPDWEMPTVNLNGVFNPGVYTLKVGLNVHDPAGVIARGVSFYVYYEDEVNKGKEATSQLIRTSDGTVTGIINNLVPDSEYSVRASFRYYDEYGRIQDEVVVIDSRAFKTKTLADLGAIEFDKMDATSNLYDKKIQVNNIRFKTSSDQDAVGSLFLVTVRTYEGTLIYGKEAEASEGFASGSQQLATLSAYESIAYTTPEILKSSTDYIVSIECRDRYGNVIVAKNDTVQTRTCKSLPLGSISLTNPLDDHGNIIVSSVILNNVVKNADAVEYDSLRVRIVSTTGEVFKNGDLDYFPIIENQTLRIDNLPLADKFNVSLLCNADNDDGKGKITRTLDMQNLSTFFDYGSIYLTGANLIKSEYKDYSADRIVFTLRINDARTNTQLTPIIEEFYFTISDDKGNVYATRYLTDAELTKLKNFETLTFDSYEFMSTKLPSNTTFNINFTDVRHENGKVVNDPINSTLSTFTTSKLMPKCYATNIQGFAGYLAADLMTVDVDDYIEGNNVLVRVRDKLTNKIIGSFSFPKNDKDYYELRLFSDAASSPDGMTYDIEGNTEYIVTFVAEEVTNSTETYVTLDTFIISTAAGVTGNIYLTSLDGEGLYEELEYIESTGTQYINTRYNSESGVQNMRIYVDGSYYDMSGWRVHGCSGSTSLYVGVYNSTIYYGTGSADKSASVTYTKGERIQMDNDAYHKTVTIYNVTKGKLEKTITYTPANKTSTVSFSLFAYASSSNQKTNLQKSRIYDAKIYDKDVLVRDFVPVRNKYTGEIGMYDLANNTFYHNDGTGDFIAGPLVTSGGRLNNNNKVTANLNIEIVDNEEWLYSKTVHVDVFKNNDKKGQSNLVDTLTFEYQGKGTYLDPNDETSDINPIKTVYNADILPSEDDYYFLKLYIELDNGSIIPISNTSFTTNDCIREISSVTDLYNLGTSPGKYVVTRDLYINATNYDNTQLMEYESWKPYDTTRGTWNKASSSPWYAAAHYLNAKIDFQGFTLEYHGYSSLFYRMEKNAKISNLVYKSFAYYTRTEQVAGVSTSTSYVNCYPGILVNNNYGTIENISIEMYQEDISGKYIYDSYWCDYPYGEGVTKYDYFKANNLVINNYGLISNFVAKYKTAYLTCCYGGLVGINLPGATIRNGYVYSDLYADEQHEYNYKAQMYAYSAYNNAVNWYNSTGCLTCSNQGGTIQNVYCLADIYCKQYSRVNYEGISVCYNYNGGVIKNTYSIGNVLRAGEPNNANYGPNIGVNTAAVRYLTEDYFISEYSYNATRNSSTDNTMNRPTGYVALKDIEWQTKVLNSGGATFEIESLINAGYYPHLNFTSNCMPSQDFIPIPSIKKTDTDVTLSYEYEWGINKTLDAELKEDIRKLLGADFDLDRYLGDLMWDEKDENGFNSQVKVEVIFVVNKSLTPVYGLEMSNRDMVVRTLKEHNDGSGITQCYSLVYNPNSAVNRYKITGVQWTDIRTGGKGSTSTLKDTNDNDITRDLEIGFYRALSNVEGDDSWQKLRANTKENFRLFNDLDFSGYGIDKIFVYNYFEGVLDGNGHTIKNVELNEGQFIDYYYNQSYQGTNAQSLSETAIRSDYTSAAYVQKTGIFSTIYGGTIENTIFENINIESGFYAGAICGYAYGALFDNVFINDAYVVGTMSAGGFAGMASGSEIADSGINNAKVMSVAGSSYSSGMSYSDPNRTGSMAGGLIGYGHAATKVNRAYANNIYVENLTSDMNYGFTGGIVGGMNDSTVINGAYASGVIFSGSRATGGIVGQVDTQGTERFNIDNCYSDMDIFGYNGSVGGLIGDARYAIDTVGRNVVFGDVICNTKMDDYTVIRQKYSLTTAYKNGVSAYTCDSANLVISESEKSTGTSFSKSIINSSSLFDYGYLSNEFFVTSSTNGVLPKLLGKNNQVLPYQNDIYIDLDSTDIKIDPTNTYSYDNSTSSRNIIGYQFGFNINSNITINKVYFDYSYVDEYLNLHTDNVMDSMTLHTPFKGGRASDSTSSTYYMVTYDDGDIKSYYDYYRITAVKYTKRNRDGTTSTYYQKINQLLDISPKTMKVGSLNDWNNNVANSRGENILLTNNINFNKVYKYTDKNINIVANKLSGPESKVTLSNVTINGGYDFSTNKGYLYDFATSFIRVTLSELKNITFDNISVERSRLCGVVHEVRGVMENVDFTNCYIGESASSYSWMPYGSGLVNYCSANITNINADNCNVICPSAYGVGILFGAFNENFYSNSFKDVTIENSTCSGTSYVGGLTGFIHNFSYSSDGETKAYYDNITLRNSTVTGSTNYIGGIIGYTYFPHYMHYLTGSLVDNCLIQSTTSGYVGGMIGHAGYIIYPSNNTVYKSTIKGVNRVGGFAGSGYIYPNSDTYTFNNTVRDCQVIGTGDYTAGALAYATYGAPSATYKVDRTIYDNPETAFYRYYVVNTEVLGNQYVAGITAHADGNYNYFPNNVVEHCTIKGNRVVGGIFGYGQQIALSSIVSNSYIGSYDNAAEASRYGITYAPDNRFGGIGGAQGGYANCIVQNCIIGGANVNQVGGLSGAASMTRKNTLPELTNTICKDCIVIGKDLVGGMFGELGRHDADYYSNATNLYSNATVYGDNHVAGIAGRLVGRKDTSTKEFLYMPTAENIYFTGTLNSNNYASLLYGQVVGNTTLTCNWLRYVSSLPKSVTCKNFTVFFAEDDEYSYTWSNLTNVTTNTSNMLVSFYGDAIITDQFGSKTLSSILTSPSSSYINYCYEDSDVVSFATSTNAGKFIRIYNTSSDIASKFHSELINPAKSTLQSSYRYVGFKTTDVANYMPLIVAYDTSTKVIFVNPNTTDMQPVTGLTITNKATGDSTFYEAMQGVYVTGNTLYDAQLAVLDTVYDTFTVSGAAACGIGSNGAVGVPVPYDDGIYYPVEYLASTSKQYIDTGYKLSTGYSFDFEWQIDYQTEWFFAANSSNYEMILGRKTSNYFGSKYRGFNYNWVYGEKAHIRMDLANGSTNSQLYENETLIADVASAFNNKELYLFGVISGASATTCDAMKTMRYYYFDIYQGSNKVMAMIPVVTESGLGGMYDTIGRRFYPSETTTPFFYGKKLSNTPVNSPPLMMAMAPKALNNITAYASDIDTLNIEFSTQYANASKDKNPYIIICDNNDNVLINKETITNFTYSINYDFDTVLKVKYGYDGSKENSYTIDPVQVSNHVMLTDNSTYAIYNHKLYINDVVNNTINYPLHLDSGLCIDKNGNVYDVSTMNIVSGVNSISKANSVTPLYTFNYDSKDIYGYVYRTVVSTNSGINVQDGTRSFVAYGNLISISTNNDVGVDPLYVKYKDGKDYTILLKKNSLYSIGDSDMISKFTGFTNEGIKAISSNIGISSTNKNLLVEYKNGSIVDINTETGKVTSIGETIIEEDNDIMSYLGNSLTSMFTMPTTTSYNLTNNRKASNTVINYMDNAGASIPDIVNLINDNDVGNIADTVMLGTSYGIGNSGGGNQVGVPEDGKINEGEGSESTEMLPSENENPTPNALEAMVSFIDSTVKEEDKPIIANYDEVLVDTAKKAIDNSIALNSNKAKGSEFVSVYNADTDSFEIYNEEELLTEESAESIDSRIVDKTKLKALYEELGEANDKSTTRGLVLYGIIALVIVMLIALLGAFKNKPKF